MGKDSLGTFEQFVLLALIRLGDGAYGMKIRREIADRARRHVAIGAVYATLDRLEDKGLVSSRAADGTADRDGRVKRVFRIEAPGLRALNDSRDAHNAMWAGLRIAPQHR
jgi:DNA-binding PadR family transcriptional regulator